MSFKIAQTNEKGKLNLCVVPTGWESDGILWWPPAKSKMNNSTFLKMQCDGTSQPEADWVKVNCIIKRKDILSFAAASKECQYMISMSDTNSSSDEADASKIMPPPEPPGKKRKLAGSSRKTIGRAPATNFDKMVRIAFLVSFK